MFVCGYVRRGAEPSVKMFALRWSGMEVWTALAGNDGAAGFSGGVGVCALRYIDYSSMFSANQTSKHSDAGVQR